MAADPDDLYSGFNEYDQAFDTQNLLQDKGFREAVVRSSYGRRPKTGALTATTSRPFTGRTATAAGVRGSTGRASFTGTGAPGTSSGRRGGGLDAEKRPMTAVRGAGYSSAQQRTTTLDHLKAVPDENAEKSAEDKCRQMERKVNELLEESILAYEKRDMKLALEKAKEAGRKERAAVRLREQLAMVEQLNLDLTFTVLFNLAHQYMANDMLNEALNTYQVIVKNKMFTNAGRLKINIGNIYFRKKDYMKAVKYYRMALDQVPNVQKEIRIRMLNNIGVAFVKLGQYEEAANTFEHCMEERGDFSTGLNLVLTTYCLEDPDKMKEAFQRLIDIPLLVDSEFKETETDDLLLSQAMSNDAMTIWERQRRQNADRTILTAAKIISSAIAANFTEGYAWCVDAIKKSIYASLATELEMNKAAELLRQGDMPAATQVLLAFNNKDSKVASAAANNLSLISLLQGPSKMDEAIEYAEQALRSDRYNPNALVNRGNICYVQGELQKAFEFYREATNVEASCIEAMYNMGLVCRQLGNMEQALDCFYKLHNILLNNVQVLCQLASIYETLEDVGQAIELYSQANNLCPTDPAILTKLADLFDAEGDKTQAFQCHYDSFRYFPSNIETIEWLAAYYIDAQFADKAVNYFEKASIMQPSEIKWQLMMASCQRRSGNYQKALDIYRVIHRRFPDNIECLKFLVRICTDLGMPEAKQFAGKLAKAEKVRLLRVQRETDSGQGKRRSPSSAQSLSPGTSHGRPTSRNSLRTASARITFDENEQYQITKRAMKSADFAYVDPLGPMMDRPKTGNRGIKQPLDDSFDNDQLDDSMLPE